MGIGIQGELLADKGSGISMNASVISRSLSHCTMGATGTDRTGCVCISGGEACVEGVLAVPCYAR